MKSSFSLNSAKSFIGKRVNLHLKDGAVIINVHITNVCKGGYGEGHFMVCVSRRSRRRNVARVFLRNIAYAEPLNIDVMLLREGKGGSEF